MLTFRHLTNYVENYVEKSASGMQVKLQLHIIENFTSVECEGHYGSAASAAKNEQAPGERVGSQFLAA